MEHEKLLACVRLGRRMLLTQKEYFRTRDPFWLDQAKHLEREFEKMTEECLDLVAQMQLPLK